MLVQTVPSPWRAAIVPFAATRVVLFVFAWVSLRFKLPAPQFWQAFPNALYLDGWARWDSGWYESIANDGYRYTPGHACNVNFFPLYSWLVGLLDLPLQSAFAPRQAFHITGMVVSLATFYLALVGLHRLVTAQFGEKLALRTLWLVALFPFSLFYSAVYTEGVFLALSVWAFALGAERKWAWACVLASLAAVTRTVGCLVAMGLFVAYLQQRRWRLDRDFWWFLLTPLPLFGLLAWFWQRFGEPLPFLKLYTTVWDKRPGIGRLIDVVNSVRSPLEVPALRFQNGVYLVVVFGAIGLSLAYARRLGLGMALYAAVSALLVALTGFNGAGRYMAVLFPAFVGLALLTERRGYRAVVVGFAPLLLWFTYDFAHWLHVC